MNTVFEGATLDILPNGAAFITSGLTGKPLYSRCLSNFKERHEQSAFVQSIRTVSYTHLTLPTKRIV